MATHWKAYHLNRMIQESLRSPQLMRRLLSDPEPVFTEFGLAAEEAAVFRNPSQERLKSIGVHPILAMVYMIPRDPKAAKQLTIDPVFLSQLKEA